MLFKTLTTWHVSHCWLHDGWRTRSSGRLEGSEELSNHLRYSAGSD